MRIESVYDSLWSRLLDVPACLGARTYATPGRVVITVDDGMRPDGAAHGTFSVEGGRDGATVARVDQSPDLSCSIEVLSAAWLGGVRWSELASAGRVQQHSDGALTTADAMFASTPLPAAYTWF